MNKFCIAQGIVVTFSDVMGKFTATVTVLFWDNANNQKYVLVVLL